MVGFIGRDSVYIKNDAGAWIEFDSYESFKVVKIQNQSSEFELLLSDIETTEKAIVKAFAEVLFLSGTDLVLKGRIQKVTYETAYRVVIKGFGMESKLLDKELYEKSNTSADWQDSKRGQWTNISAQTTAKEILSSNTDGISPFIMSPNTTGLFLTDYGLISSRYEYANRLNALGKLSKSINYDWWISHSVDFSTDYFNIAPLQPSNTRATVSQETFAITGADTNCYMTNQEKDINNLANKVDVLGRGDGINQLHTSCYNASSTYSSLSTDITSTSTTISLTDASSFPSTGTVRIMEEQVTYTSKSGNDLINCTRGANSTIAYSHKSGVFIEKHIDIDSAEVGSSIGDVGLMDLTLIHRDVIDLETLELIGSNELFEKKDPILRIVVMPDEPLETVGSSQIGDLITIIDGEADISDDYRIVSITYNSYYGDLEMEIQASNKSLSFIEQMQKQREQNENLGKYMQGATNIDTTSVLDNLENETSPTSNPAPGALDMFFHIPEDAVALNKIRLSYRLQAPKTWSGNTGAGSAHSHTLSIATSGSHSHSITIYNEAATGAHSLVGFNQPDGRLYVEASQASGGVSTTSSTGHTHTGIATDNESSHTHSVAYDLATQIYTSTDIRIFTSDDASSVPTWTEITTEIEAVLGRALNSSENSTESDIDLTTYFSKTGWKGVRIVANGACRCYTSVMSKVFIESTE